MKQTKHKTTVKYFFGKMKMKTKLEETPRVRPEITLQLPTKNPLKTMKTMKTVKDEASSFQRLED